VTDPLPVASSTRATPTLSSPSVASPPPAPERPAAPQPSPPPEDPAVIAARRAARRAALQAVLTELRARWPQTFAPHPQPVRPLATGIGKVIAAQLPQVSRRLVHQAIAFWQRQRKTAYLEALSAGGPRYDLEGQPQGEVTPEQQQRAREELRTWQAARQEKRHGPAPRSHSASTPEGRDTATPQDAPTGTARES
jgi:sRNA-binding protein